MNETVTPEQIRGVVRSEQAMLSYTAEWTLRTAAARIEELEEAARYIGEFAEAHHYDQPAYVLLHGLTIDIPDYVERALAGSFYAPLGPAGSRSDATESEA